MERKYTKQEALEILRKDHFICQVVKVIRMNYPDAKIYTSKVYQSPLTDIFPSGLSREDCTKIGKMFDPNYSIEWAGDDTDYPFYIDICDSKHFKNMVDITELGD